MQQVVDSQWLQENLATVKVLDAGIVKPGLPGSYKAEAVIPGALRFDISHALSAADSDLPNSCCSAAQFQAEMRQLGINNEDVLVAYDDKGMFSAARAWYMLKAMGHKRVYVLDGGLPAWQRCGFDVTQSYAQATAVGNFTANSNAVGFVDKQAVIENLESERATVLDARGASRFAGIGDEPRKDMRSGHIPKSLNLPYTELLDEQGLFKPKAELRKLFAARVAELSQPLIFSCGSGVTACILALVAHELGYQQVSVYDGSWSEWGSDPNVAIEQS